MNNKKHLGLALLLSTIVSLTNPNQEPVNNTNQITQEEFQNDFNAALTLFKNNKFDNALQALEILCNKKPDSAEVHFNIGLIHMLQNNPDSAQQAFKVAIKHNAHHAKAHYFLGVILQKQKNFDLAIKAYQNATNIEPKHYNAFLNMARIYRSQNNHEKAIANYAQALTIKNNDDQVVFELALSLTLIGQHQKAIALYKKLLEKNPLNPQVNYILGYALKQQGKINKAIPYFQKTLSALPDNTHAHTGLGQMYLTLGQYELGWQEFEWIYKNTTNNYDTPYWDGSDINGKTILLRTKFEPTDTLQFVRYAKLLKENGAIVYLEALPELTQLISICPYIDGIIPIAKQSNEKLPSFDFQIPLMCLPRIFNTTVNNIPADVPYLFIQDLAKEKWNYKLKQDKKLKVGLYWDATSPNDAFKTNLDKKSILFQEILSIINFDNANFYSLQQIHDPELKEALSQNNNIHVFEDYNKSNISITDIAAIIQNLDLIITVDSWVAHLAGALGKPVWLLLPHNPNWRWMQNRVDSPWYPTMKLFRQTKEKNWMPVIEMVKKELHIFNYQRNSMQPQAVSAEISIGELIDKITILQIKSERIKNNEKLHNIDTELNTLIRTKNTSLPQTSQLDQFMQELKTTNEKLWEIEDDIRKKESVQEFDEEFVQLARNVYYTNDTRCAIKRAINEFLGSHIVEEKSYSDYQNGVDQSLA